MSETCIGTELRNQGKTFHNRIPHAAVAEPGVQKLELARHMSHTLLVGGEPLLKTREDHGGNDAGHSRVFYLLQEVEGQAGVVQPRECAIPVPFAEFTKLRNPITC